MITANTKCQKRISLKSLRCCLWRFLWDLVWKDEHVEAGNGYFCVSKFKMADFFQKFLEIFLNFNYENYRNRADNYTKVPSSSKTAEIAQKNFIMWC